MDEEYNSQVRHTRMDNFLNRLKVRDFVTEKTDDVMDLTRVYKLILKVSRQVPSSHRGDAHRIDFLRRAIMGADWFREPFCLVGTNS